MRKREARIGLGLYIGTWVLLVSGVWAFVTVGLWFAARLGWFGNA